MTDMDLTQYTGKKVRLVHNLDEPNSEGHLAEEIEGTVQVGNAVGVLIKKKGRTMSDLIEAHKIEKIEEITSAPKALKPKVLKEVGLETARQHLLDRHGWKLADVNQMSDQQAFVAHGEIDHSVLGHQHGEKGEGDNA